MIHVNKDVFGVQRRASREEDDCEQSCSEGRELSLVLSSQVVSLTDVRLD
jgi:hypothetical protein